VQEAWVRLSRFGGVSEPQHGERESPGEIPSVPRDLNVSPWN